MAIQIDADSRIVVQTVFDGRTPRAAHPLPLYASNIVARVAQPGSACNGHWLPESLPAFPTIAEAAVQADCNVALIYADSSLAGGVAGAVEAAIAAGFPLVVLAAEDLSESARRAQTAPRDFVTAMRQVEREVYDAA